MGSWLRYPLDVEGQRLALLFEESAAALQLLAMVRDIAPGEFPGFLELANPCDQLREALDLEELASRISALFRAVGRPDIRAVFEADDGSARERASATGVRGSIVILSESAAGVGGWRARVPIEQRDSRLGLDLTAAEIC